MEAVTANIRKENDCYFGMDEDMDYREDRSGELILLFFKKRKKDSCTSGDEGREVLRPRNEEATYVSHSRAAELYGIITARTVLGCCLSDFQSTQIILPWV